MFLVPHTANTGEKASGKDLFEGVKTALALQKIASRQHISSHVKERQKFFTEKAAIDVEFWKYRSDVDTKLG